MFGWCFVCLLGFLGAKGGVILTIGAEEYSVNQFFAHYPKKQWENADSTKRDKIYTDFIKRELCILEARRLGLESDPEVAVKIRNHSQQLLVNESYEQLVALPLLDPANIAEARTFARTELLLSHILIGYSGAYLPRPPERSLDDALVLAQEIHKQFVGGDRFPLLAKAFSDDPSVGVNSGSLGWVRWGETVSAFQSAAFLLDVGVLSNPILTDYGYHLILVENSRPSAYQYMSDEEYEDAIINLSKRTIRNRLRGAAVAYDSLQIEEWGLYFNSDAISKISQAYSHVLKRNAGNVDIVGVLESMPDIGVVCVYGGLGVGALWFSSRIGRIPLSARPLLDSEHSILSVFKTIILQDIALKNGYKFGVDGSFSFQQRKQSIISDILYNAYLKSVVNKIFMPDTTAVREYYEKNLEELYSMPGVLSVREIRVESRALIDSLLVLVNGGADFEALAKKYSLINSASGGLGKPLSRKTNRVFFDAAMLLGDGETSPVLSAPGNLFSIILLVKKISREPLPLDRVYVRIESLLLKEGRKASKKAHIDGLLDKYSVKRHLGLLD